jgi:hypothetical protein
MPSPFRARQEEIPVRCLLAAWSPLSGLSVTNSQSLNASRFQSAELKQTPTQQGSSDVLFSVISAHNLSLSTSPIQQKVQKAESIPTPGAQLAIRWINSARPASSISGYGFDFCEAGVLAMVAFVSDVFKGFESELPGT